MECGRVSVSIPPRVNAGDCVPRCASFRPEQWPPRDPRSTVASRFLPDLVTVGTAEGITLVNADCAESTSIPRGDRLAPGLKGESKGGAVVKDSIKRDCVHLPAARARRHAQRMIALFGR